MYARGEREFMKQQFERAILEFQAALRDDPKFTLAAVRCADLLTSQHRQSEGFPMWRKAMQMLGERPLTRPEELYARGMFATDTGDMDAAEREFRRWSVEYPKDWRAPFYRMLPLVLQGHAEEALTSLETVRAAMPEYADTYAQIVACHLVLMQVAEARKLIPLLRKYEDSSRADLREAYCDFCDGDCAGYLERLRGIRRNKATSARGAIDAMIREAVLLIDANQPGAAAAESEAYLREHSAADIKGQLPVLRIVQAWAEMLAGDRSAAMEHAREAIGADTGAVLVTLAGSIFARLGDKSRQAGAVAICEELGDLPIYRLGLERIQGEGARAAGDSGGAMEHFREAARLEPKIGHRQYLIEVLPEGAELEALCSNVFRTPWQFLRPPALHNLGSIRGALARVPEGSGVRTPFAKRFALSSAHVV